MDKIITAMTTTLASVVCKKDFPVEQIDALSNEDFKKLIKLSDTHALGQILAFAILNQKVPVEEPLHNHLNKKMMVAVLRREQMEYTLQSVCKALEASKIPHIPLKGAVIRNYYPEPWMRTSCDIDILVRKEDLEQAISFLVRQHQYTETERSTHDVSLFTPQGIHVELHYDLVEEGLANNAISVLQSVWKNVTLCENTSYRYQMSDAFFYFYHIAHMAKHFETGGCGIRPFIDLWILDHMENVDRDARNHLLKKGGLLKFAEASRNLSAVWFGDKELDELSLQLQTFLLHGGVYGSTDNRVALNQAKKGGRLGYFFSRLFVSRERLQRYYPVLKKHPWLMPVMQVRRWFMLLRPDVAAMAKSEMRSNANLDKSKAVAMNDLLNRVGL